MTCKNCIHFTDECNTQYADLERFHLCDASKTPLWVEPTSDICKSFDYNPGSYHDGQWHCDRCGKPIPQYGLCDECDKWLEHAVIGAKQVHAEAVKHIHYDSWESVSK